MKLLISKNIRQWILLPSAFVLSLITSSSYALAQTSEKAAEDLPLSCRPLSTQPKDSNWDTLTCETTAPKKNRTVVLFHGLGNCPWEMKDIGEDLCKAGYDVELPLHTDHGQVAGELESTSRGEFMNSVRRHVTSAYRRFGSNPVVIGGASLGGLATYIVAQQLPEQVSAYIGFAPSVAGTTAAELLAQTLCQTGTQDVVGDNGYFELASRASAHPDQRFWYPTIPNAFLCRVVMPLVFHAQRENIIVSQPRLLITTDADEFVDGDGAATVIRKNQPDTFTHVRFRDAECDDENSCVRHQLSPHGRANPKWDFMMEQVRFFLDHN